MSDLQKLSLPCPNICAVLASVIFQIELVVLLEYPSVIAGNSLLPDDHMRVDVPPY